MQPTAADADAPLIAHLTRVASTAAATLQAMAAHDDEATRRAVDRLRRHWSTLHAGDTRQLKTRFSQVRSVGGAEAYQHGLELLSTCEQLVKAWAAQGFERAVARPEGLDVAGWHAVLDHLLPLQWNFDCDVLVVHGRMPPELAAAIGSRGQKRTLLIGPVPDTALPAGAVCASDEPAIGSYLSAFKRLAPKRHVSIDVADGLFDAATVQRMDRHVATLIQNHRTNWATWLRFAPTWRAQALANLQAAADAPDVNALGPLLAGRPAIIVSPGPSLARNIDSLRLAQGRAVLLAPLQTLRRLHREGIRPDFALVLDSQDQTTAPLDFFGDIPDDWLPDLIASNATHPNVLRRFAGRTVYFFNASTPLDMLLGNAMPSPWPALGAGSVAIACLRLARHWRCSPITLVGQDLAFADGRRYADGAGGQGIAPAAVRELPGYHGGTVQTAPDYFLYHHQFERWAATYRAEDPALRLFNCTEGGARIAGFEQQPLREMLQAHVLGLDPLPALQPPQDGTRPARHRAAMRQRLQQVRARAQEGLRLVQACERSAAQVRRGVTALNRLTAEDTRLRERVESLLFLMEERAPELDDALTAWEAGEGTEDYLRGSARFREIARTLCEAVERLLDETLQTLDGTPPAGHGTPLQPATSAV